MSKFYIKVLSATTDWQDDFTGGKIYPVTIHPAYGVTIQLISANDGEPVRFPIMYDKEEGIDWCDSTKQEYEEQQYDPDSIHTNPSGNYFAVGTQLKPIGEFRTGYAQIISIEGDVYTILTDFGNVLDCNSLELTNMYEPIGLTDFDGTTVHGPHMSVEERWNKQQELLAEAKFRLICMGYFKEDNV